MKLKVKNTIDAVACYILRNDESCTPQKLRYLLYLIYSDYLSVYNDIVDTNQLPYYAADYECNVLFDGQFIADVKGPQAVVDRYTTEDDIYDLGIYIDDDLEDLLDKESLNFLETSLKQYKDFNTRFLKMLAKQSYDYQETYKHYGDTKKVIPIRLMFVANLLADEVSICLKDKKA